MSSLLATFERGLVLFVACIDVGVRRDEEGHDTNAAVAGSEVQRRVSVGVGDIDVCAGREQHLDDALLVLRGRVVKGSQPAPGVHIHVGVMIDQVLDRVVASVGRSAQERGPAVLGYLDPLVPLHGPEDEARLLVHLRALGDEQVDHLVVDRRARGWAHRRHQRRGAVGPPAALVVLVAVREVLVDVRAGCEQTLDRRAIVLSDRYHQRIFRSAAAPGEEHNEDYRPDDERQKWQDPVEPLQLEPAQELGRLGRLSRVEQRCDLRADLLRDVRQPVFAEDLGQPVVPVGGEPFELVHHVVPSHPRQPHAFGHCTISGM